MSTPTHPLTSEHLAQIQNALDMIQQTKQQIELAKRAGIDVAGHEAQLLETEGRLRQIKNVYFPGR